MADFEQLQPTLPASSIANVTDLLNVRHQVSMKHAYLMREGSDAILRVLWISHSLPYFPPRFI